MPQPNPCWADRPWRYLLLSLYWFPVSLFWGMMLGQILPVRVEDFAGGARKGEYLGTISIIGALASAVIQIVIGPASDACRSRLGRRRPFMIFGTVVGCAAIVAFGWSRSFVELTVSFFVVQLALNIANGPFQAFIPDQTAARNQGKASAFMGLMQLLGDAGGPFVAGLAISTAIDAATRSHPGVSPQRIATLAEHARLGMFHRLLLIDAALLLVCGVVTMLAVPDAPSREAQGWRGAFKEIGRWNVRGNPNFFRLLVSCTVYNLGFYTALSYVTYYVQDSLGYGPVNYIKPVTYLQLITIVGALAATFPAGYLADRISKKTIVYISCCFSASAVVAFALAQNMTTAYVMAVAFGIGYGAFRAVDWSFGCNLLPKNQGAAKYMAIWSLAATLPQVASPSFGRVADAINSRYGRGMGWRAAMLGAAVAIVCSALLMRRIVESPLPPLELDGGAGDGFLPVGQSEFVGANARTASVA